MRDVSRSERRARRDGSQPPVEPRSGRGLLPEPRRSCPPSLAVGELWRDIRLASVRSSFGAFESRRSVVNREAIGRAKADGAPGGMAWRTGVPGDSSRLRNVAVWEWRCQLRRGLGGCFPQVGCPKTIAAEPRSAERPKRKRGCARRLRAKRSRFWCTRRNSNPQPSDP